MRQKDPRLFFLSMEVTVRRAGVKTVLVLDDEARPAILQACHPKGDSRYTYLHDLDCLYISCGRGTVHMNANIPQIFRLQ